MFNTELFSFIAAEKQLFRLMKRQDIKSTMMCFFLKEEDTDKYTHFVVLTHHLPLHQLWKMTSVSVCDHPRSSAEWLVAKWHI